MFKGVFERFITAGILTAMFQLTLQLSWSASPTPEVSTLQAGQLTLYTTKLQPKSLQNPFLRNK